MQRKGPISLAVGAHRNKLASSFTQSKTQKATFCSMVMAAFSRKIVVDLVAPARNFRCCAGH